MNTIDLIRNTVRASNPGARILLYGSRARGTARPESDWDIIVLIDKPSLSIAEKSDIPYDLFMKGVERGEEINAFIYSTQQWENSPMTLFKHNVTQDAVEL